MQDIILLKERSMNYLCDTLSNSRMLKVDCLACQEGLEEVESSR